MEATLGFIENTDLAAVGPLSVGISESVGLLALGVGLTGTAVIIRWFPGRGASETTEDDRRTQVWGNTQTEEK